MESPTGSNPRPKPASKAGPISQNSRMELRDQNSRTGRRGQQSMAV